MKQRSLLALVMVAFSATVQAGPAEPAAPAEPPATLDPVEVTAARRAEIAFRTVQLGMLRSRSDSIEAADDVVCLKQTPVGSHVAVINCATNRFWNRVRAASLANGGSFDDITPGIEYFAGLKESGNLQTIDVTEATLLSGEVPIALDWTYNFPGIAPQLEDAGFDLQVTVPSDGVYGGYYAQSVVTESAHPCSARLFLEHLVGDDGALGYLEGGAIPARYATLVEEGKVDADLAKNLPDADSTLVTSYAIGTEAAPVVAPTAPPAPGFAPIRLIEASLAMLTVLLGLGAWLSSRNR